jgi:hypothetical protein
VRVLCALRVVSQVGHFKAQFDLNGFRSPLERR